MPPEPPPAGAGGGLGGGGAGAGTSDAVGGAEIGRGELSGAWEGVGSRSCSRFAICDRRRAAAGWPWLDSDWRSGAEGEAAGAGGLAARGAGRMTRAERGDVSALCGCRAEPEEELQHPERGGGRGPKAEDREPARAPSRPRGGGR